MTPATRFDHDTSLEHLGDGTYERSVDPHWWVDRGPHGGYLAALIMRAMKAEVGDGTRAARSISVHFLRPPNTDPVTITTRVERRGRTMSAVSARLLQGDDTMALALGQFSPPWEGLTYSELTMPEVPAPEDVPPLPRIDGVTPPFFDNFDARAVLGDVPFSASDAALSGGWIRTAVERPLDEVAATVIMDAWPPSIFPLLSGPAPVPTVDFTVHFRSALPPAPSAAQDHYLAAFRSQVAQEGFLVEDGELWSRRGVLVVQSRQLAVMLRPPRR
jgi:acyl-CoA thioesterase